MLSRQQTKPAGQALSKALDQAIGCSLSTTEVPKPQCSQVLKSRNQAHKQIDALRKGGGSGGMGASWHIRKHVLELYESFVIRKDFAKDRCAGMLEGAASADAIRHPDPGSFVDVLKLYYPTFARQTLESMIAEARDGIELIDRRKWVAGAKGTYAERLKLAFVKHDKDGSGGLSMSEFVGAVQTGARAPQPDGNGAKAPPGSASAAPTQEELHALFAAADTDGDGVLDFDEFLELCAQQPWLVSAFDRIVELGVRRKLRTEEARLSAIFRHPVSPTSRLVKTPGGHRWRPSLFDLRPSDEVGDLTRKFDRRLT